jgi:hypothetical protein
MTKSKWNTLVDALLLAAIMDIAFIGILLGFIIPRGGAAGSKIFWGLHRHTWGDIHLYLSLALLGLIALHFILHLPWISAASRKHVRAPWPVAVLGLALLGALILGGLGFALQSNNTRYESDSHRVQTEQNDGDHDGPGDGQGLHRGGGQGLHDGSGRNRQY